MEPDTPPDLGLVLHHECGHVVANACKGILLYRIRVHITGSEANVESFGWRQPFPSIEEEALERQADQDAANGFAERGLAVQVAFKQRKTQAPDPPYTDRLMTYAAGYEAQKRYALAHGLDVPAIDQEARASQDYINMVRIIGEQGLDERRDTLMARARDKAQALFADDAIWAFVGNLVAVVRAVVSSMVPFAFEYHVKWYDLPSSTRQQLTDFSRYPVRSPPC